MSKPSSPPNSVEPSQGKVASPPAISVPKGGGAIRGLGEKFAANPVTGTGSLSVPIATSPGRSGFGPQISLSYDSGAGNGSFGFGWRLSLPAITRKTDKGVPKYDDVGESDVYVLSGSEDLVPVLERNSEGLWLRHERKRDGYLVYRYRPRIEGLFARIERWTRTSDGDTHWRSITKDNVTTFYGRTETSRIADPSDPKRVFSWLICDSFDDKRNVVRYVYEQENSDGLQASALHEKHRLADTALAQRHIKRIGYGNPTPLDTDADLSEVQWHFEVVFDYGDHDVLAPTPDNSGTWHCRHDPFSSYRAAFEIRTYRLCQRALMFHRFPELGTTPCLVRSTDFVYRKEREGLDDERKGHPIASFLASITHAGYTRREDGGYLRKPLPPLNLEYSRATIDERIRTLDPDSLTNLPQGLDGASYQWVDLRGEGLSGILTEQADAWFYKSNRGEGRFGPLEILAAKPSLADLSSGRQQLLDLAGDGRLDLVALRPPVVGFYELTDEDEWESFVPFASTPNVDWNDPNLKLVDLTGDGHADVLVAEHDRFTWYPSLAEEGFGAPEVIRKHIDEDQGPTLMFADGTHSVHLADMSGDGLQDLVRIRSGEICYWPNLGHGRFGPKVTMSNAPLFDEPDQFDATRIRLADIDGSGVTDVIYLGRNEIRLWFNESGNGWSAPKHLTHFPRTDHLSTVTVVDLLGNGTACLVWASPLPAYAAEPMRYIDLMGGEKPHLLIGVKNNLGAETRVHYAASTKFYLDDLASGRPWITRVPFPVHVVERVETHDWISRNRFVTRYAYHHGYFDGVEREFRGFAMVEQWDTEELAVLTAGGELDDAQDLNLDPASHVPPVRTRTWFHTGAYIEGRRVSRQLEDEYWNEGDASEGIAELTDEQLRAMLIDDTVLPVTVKLAAGSVPCTLSPDEACEAHRALKGSLLRQEVYALDGSEAQDRPYLVSERNYTLELLQPRDENHHAVFFPHAREAIDLHYERKLFDVVGKKLADPRVTHAMTLAVDAHGNVLASAAIGYGRRHEVSDELLTQADGDKQTRTLLTCDESDYTNAVDEDDAYRAPLPSEVRGYEFRNIEPTSEQALVTNLFRFAEIEAARTKSQDLPHEDLDAVGVTTTAPYRRLIDRVRTRYRRNDLSDLLPFGQLESRALPGESYRLAFTPGLLAATYGDRVTSSILSDDGGYVTLEGDDGSWMPSGRVFYSTGQADSSAVELDVAHGHFFLPHRFRDPFGNTTTIRYDEHGLLVLETEDALGNKITAGNDYRVLQPAFVTDPNGNRTELAFDALGLVVGIAVRGKLDEGLGDRLEGFEPDLSLGQIEALLADPAGTAKALLGLATTRVVYDVDRYFRTGDAARPVFAATLTREQHASDLPEGQESPVRVSFGFSDGFGREIQKKIQAESGPLVPEGPDVGPRWAGSGWTVFNNKSKPVRQYEPFFSATHDFEFAKVAGVSPILFYDPVERVIATLHPNHTYEKVLFDPWRQETWDVNDTVQLDPRTDPDTAALTATYFATQDAAWQTWLRERIDPESPPLDKPSLEAEKKAALRTLSHAGTQAIAYTDTLGRTVLTVADNGEHGKYATRIELDIEGNQRAVIDARGRTVMRYDVEHNGARSPGYDMLGNRTHQESADAGMRLVLHDVLGNPVYRWDSRGQTLRTTYDELRRPTEVSLRSDAGPTPVVVERTVYGESQGEVFNHRGKVYQRFDGAGVLTHEAYDFKGNLVRATRKLAREYKATLDWSDLVSLEDESFTSHAAYDALNRVVASTSPDQSLVHYAYNEAGLLESIGATLRGAVERAPFVVDVDYNAKGQRERIQYGNGVVTNYEYDQHTFRLIRLRTLRAIDCLQDLSYEYDPTGNITSIRDDAQQTIFFNNAVVEPHNEYLYDANYRLVRAEGREHIGQVGQPQPTWDDGPRMNNPLPHPNDGQAMRRYVERYEYDEVGNILAMVHSLGTLASPGPPIWNRRYQYRPESNRLLSTSMLGEEDEPTYGVAPGYAQACEYDAHGNMTRMSHIPSLAWNFEDQLGFVDLEGGGVAWYVYEASGQRARKVVERAPGMVEERIYLGGFEVFRHRDGSGGLVLERETLHVMNGKHRVALVETKTHDSGSQVPAPKSAIRFHHSNHLGSAALELDHHAELISYEEYYAYGSTSFRSMGGQVEASKRYRFAGKERDEETALYYNGARYYASWLGRWTAPDPAGLADGTNLWWYGADNPIRNVDPTGYQHRSATSYEERMVEQGGLEVPYAPASGKMRQGMESVDALSEKQETKEAIGPEIRQGQIPESVESVDPDPIYRSSGGYASRAEEPTGKQSDWREESFAEYPGYSYSEKEPDTSRAELLAEVVLMFEGLIARAARIGPGIPKAAGGSRTPVQKVDSHPVTGNFREKPPSPVQVEEARITGLRHLEGGGTPQRAGTIFHEGVGANPHKVDIVTHRGAVQTEWKTSSDLSGAVPSATMKLGSKESLARSVEYQRATQADGGLVPIRIVRAINLRTGSKCVGP